MRKLTLLVLAVLAAAFPLAADDRHQSFISYDDGGTLIRVADEDREVEARVNLPVFPGDEIITDRRGRTEVRLADGNVLALDRATAVRFRSILDSYEGDSSETIVQLRYGKIAVYRIDDTRDYVRVDTPSASYFASNEAIFSVETDSAGRDRVFVFDGTIEVRTPDGSTRLRHGEQAEVDESGDYDVADFSRYSADDFERWFLRRAERYGGRDSRYLDRSLSYYDDELSRHGSWVYVNAYGWAWRPTVSVGWRPYYNGYWYRARSGCLNWVSYEPWGWVPYHYGRWAYDPFYGWFWVPGVGYAPAWVYWWYGPSYIGWAPAGWWDLHHPYYGWAYRPYYRYSPRFGAPGFYGRFYGRDADLKPWVFVDSKALLGTRVDKSSLASDIIRNRLNGDKEAWGVISNQPAKFTREEFRNPADAVNKRWKGVDTGRFGAGPAADPDILDVTPFVKRQAELPVAIKERIVGDKTADPGIALKGGGVKGGETAGGGVAPIGGGSVAPIAGGGVAPIGGGDLAPIGRGSSTKSGEKTRDRDGSSTWRTGGSKGDVKRGETGSKRSDEGVKDDFRKDTSHRDRDTNESSKPAWRDPVKAEPRDDGSKAARPEAERKDWRSGATRTRDANDPEPRKSYRSESSDDSRRNEVPRRVIDRIGGARVQTDKGEQPRTWKRGGESSGSSGSSKPGRSSISPPPRIDSGSSGGGHKGGGGGYSGGSSGSGGSSKGSSGGSSGSSGGSSGSSGSSGGGGKSKNG